MSGIISRSPSDKSGIIGGFPSGSVIQTQFTNYTGQTTMSSIGDDTMYPITSGTAGGGSEILNVTIIPRVTNSTFLLTCQIMYEGVGYAMQANHTFAFFRDSTKLAQSGTIGGNKGVQIGWAAQTHGSDDDSTANGVNFRYVDSPAKIVGASIVYKPAYQTKTGGGSSLYINRCGSGTTTGYYETGISNMSVSEIAP